MSTAVKDFQELDVFGTSWFHKSERNSCLAKSSFQPLTSTSNVSVPIYRDGLDVVTNNTWKEGEHQTVLYDDEIICTDWALGNGPTGCVIASKICIVSIKTYATSNDIFETSRVLGSII